MRAFIGIGLLGKNFTIALIKKGEKVQVWNRTTSKAKELEQFGAIAFEKVEDAVKGADLIHLTLRDDESVDEILAQAKKGLKSGVVIADHTTTSIDGAIKRTQEWREKGFYYQHAPVLMGPHGALNSTGFMLVSGNQDLIKRINPQLSMMTGKLLNYGAEPGRAAAVKLTANLFLSGLNGSLSDTISFAHAMGISREELLDLFSQWDPGLAAEKRIAKITAGNFSTPSWKLETARKDVGLFLKEAKNKNIQLSIIPGVAALMDKWIRKGHGDDDWGVIGKLN